MLTATANVDGATVALACDDRPNPLASGPAITALVGGTAVHINPQHRLISSAAHSPTCTWATAWKCTCAPTVTDPAPLFAAAADIAARWWAARNAANAARPYPTTDQDVTRAEDRHCCPSKATGGPCTCC